MVFEIPFDDVYEDDLEDELSDEALPDELDEELRKTGSVLDEESGMLIVIPKLIQFF